MRLTSDQRTYLITRGRELSSKLARPTYAGALADMMHLAAITVMIETDNHQIECDEKRDAQK